MKKCPFCAEEIQDEAIKCRYCGEFLEEPKSKNKEELFDVIFHNCGNRKIDVIKILRETLNIGLVEAKDMAENPGIIQKSTSKANAEDIKRKLETVGAQIEIVPENSIVEFPTLNQQSESESNAFQTSSGKNEKDDVNIKKIFYPFLIVVVAIIIMVFFNSISGFGEKLSTNSDKSGAWQHCKSVAKMYLKSPSSADFAPYDADDVSELSNGNYKVITYVDAENSFGASLRTYYICVVEKNNNRWSTVTFDFD